jgi:phospholipid/cholesterol/gamma-HCH transport system substrate-binding protein
VSVRQNETVVGIIIFCSLVILFLGLMWLQNYRLKGRGYFLNAYFEEVSGLNKGDPVTIAGLVIGRVQDMKLEGRKVSVRLWIEGKQSLPRGSVAVLKSQGVMGEKYVNIILGSSSESLEHEETIPGLYEPDFGQIASLIGGVEEDIRAILSTTRSLLDDTTKERFRESVEDLHTATAQFRTLLIENAGYLDETIVNLHTLSATLAEVSSRENPEGLIPNLESTSDDLAETARHLRGFSISLDSLFQPTLRGEGTLGKLLADEALYRDMRHLITDLDSLVQDIQRNPHRYVQVKIF